MRAILLGANSEIGTGLRHLLQADGWEVSGWARSGGVPPENLPPWRLAIVAIGQIAPVGWWHDTAPSWGAAMESNLLLPLQLLHAIWSRREPGAYVCWLAGSNPNTIMDGYGAYNVSKMAVLKAVEQLDHESDATVFALGPGIVLTKIHDQSKDWHNPKLEAARKEGRSVPISHIYNCMKWALGQPKAVIGGRNLCASDAWGAAGLDEWLRENPDGFKLRRREAR